MEILTEFDELQEAMKKINLNESVMPYINGILVDDSRYNKVQKILDCPEMISAHKYLYDLDLDQLSEEESDKIDRLYKLGVDRGFIQDDLTDWDADDAETPVDAAAQGIVANDDTAKPEEKPIAGTLFKAKNLCWTVIYSATTNDGQIKTGEAYSNAISTSAAKADVKAKLSSYGYSNISILAIESCEADVEVDNFKSSEVEENDMLNNRPHNAHVSVAEADDEEESDDSSEESSDEETSDEEASDEESSDDSEESSDEESDDSSDEEESDEESDEESSDDSEESSDDSSDEESSDDSSEESDDEESSDDSEESSDEESDDSSDEEESDDSSEESDDEEAEELDANQKAELKDKYKKTFKNTLVKCKFETSFNDLTLEQKVKFFTELSKAWKKNEPKDFMTDKEIEQLNNVVVNPDNED